MNPRAIALQGVGFGAFLVAVQGFAVVNATIPEFIEPYSTEDGFSRAKFIDLQNKALINMLTTFVASGALE